MVRGDVAKDNRLQRFRFAAGRYTVHLRARYVSAVSRSASQAKAKRLLRNTEQLYSAARSRGCCRCSAARSENRGKKRDRCSVLRTQCITPLRTGNRWGARLKQTTANHANALSPAHSVAAHAARNFLAGGHGMTASKVARVPPALSHRGAKDRDIRLVTLGPQWLTNHWHGESNGR